MTNGKQKGAGFERLVCVKLSLWVSNGEREDLYWRAAMSGGRATVASRKGKHLSAQSGDISCIHHMGSRMADQYYFECKFYRDLKFGGLITGKGHLLEFWRETRKQAKHYNKRPFMIAKQNQYPIVICLSREGARRLRVIPHLTVPKYDLCLVMFDDFLKSARAPQ